jgi:hypothetical protein
MKVNPRAHMLLLSMALIVALAGCATSSPSPSAPVAGTAAGTPSNAALMVEATAGPKAPTSQPPAPQAKAPAVATAARSDAAASAPPTAAEPAAVTATQPSPPSAAPAQPTTDPSLAALIQEELWVTGPPVFYIMSCMEAPAGAEMPAASWEATLDIGHLCLWGFTAGEDIAYELYDAAGDQVDAGTTQTGESLDGPPVADVMVELSDRTSGEWTVRAASPSVRLDTTLAVDIPPAPRLRGVPGPQVAAGHTLESLAAGDQITVIASGMPANDTVALGVYKTEEGPNRTTHFQRVSSGAAQTDGNGEFESVLKIEPSDSSGDYCVVVPLKAEYVPSTEISADGATVCFTVSQ